MSIATVKASVELDYAVQNWGDQLLRDGYIIVPEVIDRSTLDAFCTDLDPDFRAAPYCSGPFYGETTKRFGRLLLRSSKAASLAQHALIFGIVQRVLLNTMCNTVLLNLTQAIEIHPGAPLQYPHRDQDAYGGIKGQEQYMVNVMWALDDFTAENGATRVWPGSHLTDPNGLLPESEAVSAAMSRGSALLFLGSVLHAGGENSSNRPRRGAIFGYCQGWLRPMENPWLAYPPAIASKFSDELAALVGYSCYRPNLGNFEGQCPSILLAGDARDHYRFADSLRSDQMQWVRDYQEKNSFKAAA